MPPFAQAVFEQSRLVIGCGHVSGLFSVELNTVHSTSRNDLVFDIGAHLGEDSAYYLSCGFRVVSVECEPEHVKKLRRRFEGELSNGRLTLVEKAIGRRAGPTKFYRNKTVSVFGTMETSWAERNLSKGTEIEEISVDAIIPHDLFATYGIPHFLKIDIEGMDLEVLRALEAFEGRPSYVSIESETISFAKLKEEFVLFQKLGYDEFKLSPQHSVQKMKLPNPSRHGAPSDYRFEEHSSGPFGEDIEGPWLNEREALAEYKGVFILYDLFDALQKGVLQGSYKDFLKVYGHDADGWYDTHARHSSVRHRNFGLYPTTQE
jgi:FkbM family methyltransferase